MSMKRNFLIAAMAVVVCACDKGIDVDAYIPESDEIRLDMLYPGQETRVTDTAFEADDKIGVYVTASDASLQLAGNVVNNEPFVYNGTLWTASRRNVYWNDGSHNIYAYYPYSESVNDVVDYSFSVQTDQSTHENFSKSDFLWASKTNVTASDEPVQMQFAHKMSKVNVYLTLGEEFVGNPPSDCKVYILNTVPQAVVDLSTGDVAKDNFAAVESIQCKKDGACYSAIVVPQSITSRRPLVEVIVGSVSYLMEGKISFRQGYEHKIYITLNQSPDQVKIEIGGQIDSWNN